MIIKKVQLYTEDNYFEERNIIFMDVRQQIRQRVLVCMTSMALFPQGKLEMWCC